MSCCGRCNRRVISLLTNLIFPLNTWTSTNPFNINTHLKKRERENGWKWGVARCHERSWWWWDSGRPCALSSRSFTLNTQHTSWLSWPTESTSPFITTTTHSLCHNTPHLIINKALVFSALLFSSLLLSSLSLSRVCCCCCYLNEAHEVWCDTGEREIESETLLIFSFLSIACLQTQSEGLGILKEPLSLDMSLTREQVGQLLQEQKEEKRIQRERERALSIKKLESKVKN